MMTQRNDGLTDHRVHGERDGHVMPRTRLFLKGLLPAFLIGVLAGFTGPADSAESRTDKPKTFLGALDDQVILWQNWDDDKRQKFWFTEQGSQIIPYDWFLALELPNSEELFSGKENMDRLRYIPQGITDDNLDELPIGFTKDKVWYSKGSIPGPGGDLASLEVAYQDKGNPKYTKISSEWLGLTCAACHTNQIEFNGKKIVIDGAPAMGDFEGLMKGLVESMEATRADDAKFDRFADKVFKLGNAGTNSKDVLKEHLEDIIDIRKAWNTRNSGDGVKYGFGRLDAFNSIMNEVSSEALGIPENRRPANAPVSFPFIWDSPHHDYIQWNGMVGNDAKGALGRNVGEVLGVFGSLKFEPSYANPENLTGYDSSVRIPNLGRLEHLLVSLWSPLWPDSILPPANRDLVVNKDLVDTGENIFKRQCKGCHGTIDAEDERRLINSTAIPVRVTGTDDAMARVFFERKAKTGPLQGQYVTYFPLKENKLDIDTSAPRLDGDEALAAKFLRHAVAGTLARDRVATGIVIQNTIRSGLRTVLANDQPTKPSYKARPLNGIWATAPYLHNGSVPTLMQLLKPSKREEVFYVGSREFDPVEVGFKYRESDYGPDDPKFLFNTLRKGNRNTGHTYYRDYFEKNEKKFDALMAYLKTL